MQLEPEKTENELLFFNQKTDTPSRSKKSSYIEGFLIGVSLLIAYHVVTVVSNEESNLYKPYSQKANFKSYSDLNSSVFSTKLKVFTAEKILNDNQYVTNAQLSGIIKGIVLSKEGLLDNATNEGSLSKDVLKEVNKLLIDIDELSDLNTELNLKTPNNSLSNKDRFKARESFDKIMTDISAIQGF